MRTRIDKRLVEEAERYRLKYSCEACGHFDHDNERCSLGYPEPPTALLEIGGELDFCKEFDVV